MKFLFLACLGLGVCSPTLRAQSNSPSRVAVTTRHAPKLNGQARVEGSVQVLLGEGFMMNGGATLTEDLLVPGTPTVTVNGKVSWQGVQPGSGSASPGGYSIQLNGGAVLRYVRTRTNPVAIPDVSTPPASPGTRSVTLNQKGQSVGDWATVRDLTLNCRVGQVAVPPGAYRNFTANGQSGFKLGIAGSAQPVVYSLENLTLNGQSTVTVVGPVILHMANGFNANGEIGVAARPHWLQIRIAHGGMHLNSHSTVHGAILAPNGQVTINSHATLCGSVKCDRFTLNGCGLVKWRETTGGGGNQAPVAHGQSVTTAEDQSVAIVLTGSDPEGQTLAYTVATAPQHGTLSGSAPNLIYTPNANDHGLDSFTFTVNDGVATSAPAAISLTVTPVNDAPVAHAQSVVTTEDTALVITLTGSDLDGDALSYRIVTPPSQGALQKDSSAGAGAGDYLYTPAFDSTAPDSFVFEVADGRGGLAQATVQITITAINDRPVAAPLHLSVPEDGQVAVTLVGLDPEGELLRYCFDFNEFLGGAWNGGVE
jgi:VCBS repeat-containing protein